MLKLAHINTKTKSDSLFIERAANSRREPNSEAFRLLQRDVKHSTQGSTYYCCMS